MTTLTLNCCVKETALGNQDYFKIIIDTDKNGHDLKKLIWENIGILDINIPVWKVKIPFSEKENLQLENVEGMEIKNESSVEEIFNNRVEDNIYIQVYHVCKMCKICKICGKNNLSYLRTTSKCETSNLMIHQEEYAKHLGDRKIETVDDFEQLKKLMGARIAFLNKFEKEGKNLEAFVGPGIVDDKLSLIVIFPDETVEICLPATFEGYQVLFRYGVAQLASNPRVYHEILRPGISIGCSEAENAFTLGAFFQTSDKKFILTAGHAIGEGRFENDPKTSPCAQVTFKFHGVNESSNLLDYAFCEVENCHRVPLVNTNKPLGDTEIVIHKCKSFIRNDPKAMSYVYKCGRTSYLTKGIITDQMMYFYTDTFGKVLKVSALLVSGINGQPFGKLGDSGSAVFDNDGCLWGIYYAFDGPYHFPNYVKTHKTGSERQWIDSSVRAVTVDEVHNGGAYLLFYERVNELINDVLNIYELNSFINT
ncbi:unnamed protein product [Rhizophagus irregularis]|uniref:Crinkler effector protein N-terminal domain-containing protein n=1 Tax=Rhizophagus irregularis TaxID=588596 RepID=A0A916E4H8_9GLOM|nr:unnamed protein product [Rhizophagus irregularis]CAB5358342.1 unnamed protein product [Rhizophagus irregularis]